MKLRLVHYIGGAFAIITIIFLIVGSISIYSLDNIQESINFLMEKGWETANGASSTTLGYYEQMIYSQFLTSNTLPEETTAWPKS